MNGRKRSSLGARSLSKHMSGVAFGAALSAVGVAGAQPHDSAAEEEPIDVLVRAPPSPVGLGAEDTSAHFTLRERDMQSAGATLAELLTQSPGVEVTRAGGSADLATVAVRGSSAAQLPVYLGGVRLNDEITGSIDLSTLPVWMLHRMQLQRGHSGLQADRLGVAGALLLVPRIARRTEGRLRLGLSSFGGRSAALSAAFGNGRAASLLALRYRRSRGDFPFSDDRGTAFDPSDDRSRHRRNADHQQFDFWNSASVRLPDGQLDVLVHGFSRRAGAAGLQLVGSRKTRSRVHRALAAASVTLPCYRGADDCRLQLDSGLLRARYGLFDPLLEAGPDARVMTAGLRFTERLRVALSPRPNTTVWLGAGFEGGQLWQQRDRRPARRSARLVLRPEVAITAAPWPQLHVDLKAALNCHTTRSGANNSECGVLQPAGQLGVRWQWRPSANVFANVGRYVRVPTLGELYGITATVRGNHTLRPERGTMLDVGIGGQWRKKRVGAFAQLVGFVRWADDLIVYRRTSLGAVSPYNAATARVMGVEAAVGGHWGRTLRVRGAITVVDPRDRSADSLRNDTLPLRSRLTAFARAALRSPHWNTLGLSFA
ncbi:MAG TPA: TonB-dependent receptor, partial [Sorangium sp.]|nr:TonB-dependent receptor [Sorangium sp.]